MANDGSHQSPDAPTGFFGIGGERARNAVLADPDRRQEFALAMEIFQIAWGLPFAPFQDPQKDLAALFFVKIRTDYQAVIMLAELGMCIQAETILRSLLETLAQLALLCRDPSFVNECFENDLFFRRKVLQAAVRGRYPNMEEDDPEWAERNLEPLRQEIAETGRQRETVIAGIFERLVWISVYETHYRFLCKSAHADLRALERLIGLGPSAERTLLVGPLEDGVSLAIHLAMRWLVEATRRFADLAGIEPPESLDALDQRRAELAACHPDYYIEVLE